MYVVSILASFLVWQLSSHYNILFAVGMAALAFELVNLLLIEGVQATVFKKKMFVNIKQQAAELVIPLMVYIVVIPFLMLHKSDKELIVLMLYTLFFLLIVVFFSYEFTKQLSLRKSASSAFIQVLEERIAPSLSGHGNRVGIIIENLIEEFNYPKRSRNDLIQAAVIHDIGKALIPSQIFNKRGDLTLSEEREYQSHAEKAVEIVKTMFPNDTISDWVLFHHERWDGKGFPEGLQREEIPLEARLIALANELDHIILRQKDPETILNLIKAKSGTFLDPSLVEKIEFDHILIILEDINGYPFHNDSQNGVEKTIRKSSQKETYSSMGESFFVSVGRGTNTSLEHEVPQSLVNSLAKTANERQDTVHETLTHNNRTLDLYAQPYGNGEATIFVHDLTPFLNYRRNLEMRIMESYSEIVNTLSSGKITIHTTKPSLTKELGDFLESVSIRKNSDVPKCREIIKTIVGLHPLEIGLMKVQIAVTEAVTNILKHATNGELSVYKKGEKLQFLVSDEGSGIPLHEVPKTILVSGYTSKRSLGQGFKLISSFSDAVYIFTSSGGTWILIEYNILQVSNV
jgi:anti-sigma regulatory factor (Ser/Thr protein kinase)